MHDQLTHTAQPAAELEAVRRRVAELEALEAERQRAAQVQAVLYRCRHQKRERAEGKQQKNIRE